MRRKTYQGLEEDLLSLDDIELSLRIVMVRMMMRHRKISIDEISEEIDLDSSWIGLSLRGKAYSTIYKKHLVLDKIESAITKISDRKGGIPNLCCGMTIEEYQALLKE